MDDQIKILLVEDDAMIVKMYERKFGVDNFKLLVAFNGEEALVKLKDNRPDIILLDIMMPKMNGLETLKRIKADEMFNDIPVVMLTNLGDRPEDVDKCKNMGAVDYLVKANTSLEDIIKRVREVVGR